MRPKANMAQYAQKLSEGDKALLDKHASYRIDVSPSHRTASRIVGRAHSSISGALSVTWKPPSQIHEIEALIPLA